MRVYKRGGVWWYEFSFNGSRIRESAHTTSRTIAREAELKRRRDLALSINGLVKRESPPLFPVAAKQWLDSKTALTPLARRYYDQYVAKLKRHFGNCLISDITPDDIADGAKLRDIVRTWSTWCANFVPQPHAGKRSDPCADQLQPRPRCAAVHIVRRADDRSRRA